VSSMVDANVGAASTAVGLPDMDLPAGESLILESLTLASVDLGTAACCALAGSVTGARLPSLTGDGSGGIGVVVGIGVDVGAKGVSGRMLEAEFVGGTGVESWADEGADRSKELLGSGDGATCVSGVAGVGGEEVSVAAGTVGDWTIGDWSSAMMIARVRIGALSWLSAGVSVDEAAGAAETWTVGVGEATSVGVGETGVIETRIVGAGETGAEGVENCVAAVDGCAGTFGSECVASPAAFARADESSGDFGLASVGTGEFAGALALPEVAGKTSGALVKFGVGSAPAGPFAASGAEEVAMETDWS